MTDEKAETQSGCPGCNNPEPEGVNFVFHNHPLAGTQVTRFLITDCGIPIYSEGNYVLYTDYQALEQKLAQAREDLGKFGRCLDDCGILPLGTTTACTCGFSAAKEKSNG